VELNLVKNIPSVWRVSDAMGRLVFQKKMDNTALQQTEILDLQGFVRGVYFLTISVGEQALTEKLVFN
jgi:hypothetical protein